MKNLWLNTIRFTLLCLSVLIGIGLGTASCFGQNAQAMVKQQPFPYKTGIALDSAKYAQIKAKLEAAEQLRQASRQAVDSLQREIKLTRQTLDDLHVLAGYDARKADSLGIKLWSLESSLITSQESLNQAQSVFDKLLAELPRKVRKTLGQPTPEQLLDALTDYVSLLQARKWKWAGASLIMGGAGSLFGLILLR